MKDIDIRASISLLTKGISGSLDYSGPAVAVLSKTFLAVAVLFPLHPAIEKKNQQMNSSQQFCSVQEPVHGWPGRPCGIPVCGRVEPQVVPLCRPHLQAHKLGAESPVLFCSHHGRDRRCCRQRMIKPAKNELAANQVKETLIFEPHIKTY